MTKNNFEDLKIALNRLRENEEKVGKDVLEKRYSKKYKELKTQVCQLLTEVLNDFLFSGLRVLEEDKGLEEDLIARVAKICEEEKEKGTLRELREVAFSTYSVDSFLNAACNLYTRIMYEGYGPYWVTLCKYKDGRYYNRLINMYYDEETKMWIRENEDGTFSFSIYYPPTMKQLKEDYEKEKERVA